MIRKWIIDMLGGITAEEFNEAIERYPISRSEVAGAALCGIVSLFGFPW